MFSFWYEYFYDTLFIQKNIDTTPKHYINQLKLTKSKELLRESTLSISEISEMLGFSSIHYFSKKFKSYFGICPSEYSKSIPSDVIITDSISIGRLVP